MQTYLETIQAAKEAASRVYNAIAPHNGGRKWSVRVHPSDTASMLYDPLAGFVLGLPNIAPGARLSEADAEMITAYWLHEMSHACWTNFDVWNSLLGTGLSDLVNGLEDVRIEGELIKTGKAPNAHTLLAKLLDRKTGEAVSKGWRPMGAGNNLPWELALYGRLTLLGYNAPQAPLLPAKIAAQFAPIFAALAKCRSTSDVVDLARTIQEQQAQPAQQPESTKPQKQKGEGKGQQGQASPDKSDEDSDEGEGENEDSDEGEDSDASGQSDEGEDSEDSDASGQSDEGEDSDASGQSDEGEDSDNGSDGNGSQAGGTGAGHGAPPDKSQPTINPDEDLSSLADRINNRNGRMIKSSGVCNFDRHSDKPLTIPQYPLDELSKLITNTAKLRADISRLVKSPERVGRERFLASGRLDRRAVTRLSDSVFMRRTVDEGQECAVYLLLDMSGSMAGINHRNALALALALGDALDRARVPFEIAGFYNVGNMNFTSWLSIAKRFGQSWHKARADVVRLNAGGGTSLAPAVMAASLALAKVPNVTRRIVLALTDGDDGFGIDTLRQVRRFAATKGIEVAGIGMGTEVASRFDVSVTVNDPNQVSRAGLGVLVKALEAAPAFPDVKRRTMVAPPVKLSRGAPKTKTG